MIMEILTYPENKSILTIKSREYNFNEGKDVSAKEICENLIDTLKSTKTGVGISAIQVGYPYRICIIKNNGQYIPMINPVIARTRGEIIFNEGCLSAPDVHKKVKRFQKVWCEYYDIEGNKKEISQGGLCSIIIQHELDHFDGWCHVFENVEVNE